MTEESNACVHSGASGPFAVNLWFKSNITDNSGTAFAYLLSAFENSTTLRPDAGWPYDTNSLEMMLPQVYRTVRTSIDSILFLDDTIPLY